MPRRQTPLEVMFSLFKTSFTLSHRAFAELLLSDLPLTNGQPTAQMAQDTSWLSRTIVHSQPGSLEDRYFADWSCASNQILHKLREKGYSNADIYTMIAAATDTMAQALGACGRKGSFTGTPPRASSAASQTKMTGLLSQSRSLFRPPVGAIRPRAIAYIRDRFEFAENVRSFTPSSISFCPCDLKQTGTEHAIGLIRIDNELVIGGPYVIEPSAMGSIIGALALEDGAVTDVGLDVSARHLRIFAENNAWYAQDLGSTNGTHLIRTVDNNELDISSGAPAQLYPGDILRLGLSTTFAVVATTAILANQHY